MKARERLIGARRGEFVRVDERAGSDQGNSCCGSAERATEDDDALHQLGLEWYVSAHESEDARQSLTLACRGAMCGLD